MAKTTKHFGVAGIAVCLVIFCAILLGSKGSLGAQANQSASSKGLEGTWSVTVTQYDCNTGAPRPPFEALLAFARGGTMSETTASPAFLPGQRTSGYGVWSQGPDGIYSSIDDAFILFAAGPFARGKQRINHSISIADDGDHFNDEAIVQFFDTNGTLTSSGCARADAARLQ